MTAERPVVSRQSVAKKVQEGIAEQGWMIVGREGSWTAVAEHVIAHLERKGIEVRR